MWDDGDSQRREARQVSTVIAGTRGFAFAGGWRSGTPNIPSGDG
jgi:hypothetical protein